MHEKQKNFHVSSNFLPCGYFFCFIFIFFFGHKMATSVTEAVALWREAVNKCMTSVPLGPTLCATFLLCFPALLRFCPSLSTATFEIF